MKKYKEEQEVKDFLMKKYKLNYEEYNKVFYNENELNNISSSILEETDGYPILVKFLLFGKGLAEDVKRRYSEYLASDEMKLQTMLICAILDRGGIPITEDMLSNMNIKKYAYQLTNETLIFSKIENKWKTIHLKWDLELLAYLYTVSDNFILEGNIEILKKSLQSIIKIIKSEKDQYFILATLYDSTTVETEDKNKLPIDIIECITAKGDSSYINNLSEFWRYCIYNYYIAKNYYYLKQYKKSLDAIEEALKIYPDEKIALSNKGLSLAGLARYEEAIEYFDKALAIDPNYVDAWSNKGDALGKLARYEDEIGCYDEIINKLDPKNVIAWNNKGVSLGNLGKDEEAIACYDEIINKLDPKNVIAWYNKGVSLGKLARFEEAIACYDEIINKLDPKNVNAWNNKGLSLVRLARYEEAIACYDEIINKLDPKYVNAWNNKGLSLAGLARYEEAIEYFDKALAIDPNYVDALTIRKTVEEILQDKKNGI